MKENKTVYKSGKKIETGESIKKRYNSVPTPDKMRYIVRTKFAGDTLKAIEFSIASYNKYISKIYYHWNRGISNSHDTNQLEYLISRAVQATNNMKVLMELDKKYESTPRVYKTYTT